MSPVRSWSERRKEAAAAPSFKPLDPATYNFVIKEPAKVRQTNAGKSSWNIRAHVEDGERANASIFHDFYDSDKPAGLSFLFDQFEALGLSDFLDTEPTDEAVAQALQGRRFTADVYNDTYEGKVRQKLRNFRAPSGPPQVGPSAGPGGPAFGGPGSLGSGPFTQQGGPAGPVPQAAPVQQQPVAQNQPYTQSASTPVQQPANQPPAVQQYAQQQAQQPVTYQPVAEQAVQGGVNPWATDGATPPPLPQF